MPRRLLLLCGLSAPALYALADLWAGLLSPGYSFRDQTISELGALGAPTRALFGAVIWTSYLLLLAFGVGARQSAGTDRHLRWAAELIIGFALIALLVGWMVPMAPRGTPQGLIGTLHLVEGGVEMLILLLAMGFAATALGGGFRRYTVVTIAVMLAFGTWTSTAGPRVAAGLPTPWLGVIERVLWYAYQLWFAAFAFRLLRRPVPPRLR